MIFAWNQVSIFFSYIMMRTSYWYYFDEMTHDDDNACLHELDQHVTLSILVLPVTISIIVCFGLQTMIENGHWKYWIFFLMYRYMYFTFKSWFLRIFSSSTLPIQYRVVWMMMMIPDVRTKCPHWILRRVLNSVIF